MRVVALVCVLVSCLCGIAGAAPIAPHPENPRYFLWRDKPVVLMTSAEHYGALLNLDFDYTRYFSALQEDGLNLSRIFSGTYVELPHSFGITDNTLAPEAERYLAPWARTDEPAPDGRGGKYDLTQWNPDYFARLHDMLKAADAAGVVVEFTLFCALYEDPLWAVAPMNARNNINGVGNSPRGEVYKLMHDDLTTVQEAFTRKIVQELKDHDNLIYEICNEPYVADTVNMAWQHRMADVIVEEERKLGVRHMISLNVANKKARIDAPHPGVSLYNFHYAAPEAVSMNWDLNVALGDNETGFDGKEDFPYRSEAWDFMLAGGALFNHLDYSFTAKHPEGDFMEFASPGGGGPAIRKQIGLLKRFLEGFDFLKLSPALDKVSKVSKPVRAQAMAEPGVAYAVYLRMKKEALAAGTPITAEFELDLPEGAWTVEWLHPRTGEELPVETIEHGGGERTMTTPEFFEDMAVAVRRVP